MAKKLSVLIVDDHPLFREGVKAIISRDRTLMIAGEAGSRKEGFRMAKDFVPDLVTVDVSLPDGSGIELVRDICEKIAGPKVMMLSMHAEVSYIVKAFEAGALGYIVKESASETLTRGLHTVAKGEYFLDAGLTPQVVQRLMGESEKKLKIKEYHLRCADSEGAGNYGAPVRRPSGQRDCKTAFHQPENRRKPPRKHHG